MTEFDALVMGAVRPGRHWRFVLRSPSENGVPVPGNDPDWHSSLYTGRPVYPS